MTFQRSFMLAALALLGACAVLPDVDTFVAPEVDFADRKSFAWKGGEFALSENTRPDVAAAGSERIREAVVAELVRKGYVETADAAAADMLVSFQVGAVRRTVMPEPRVGAPLPSEVLTVGGQPTPAASELPRERTVREGTVVVFVEDPASGRVGWRGLVNVEGRVGSQETAIRQITDIARHITKQFPVRRAAK